MGAEPAGSGARRIGGLPRQHEIKGVALMMLGIAVLSAHDAVSKYLAERYPIGQVVCLRQLASLLFILPFALATAGLAGLRVVNVTGQLRRAVAFVGTAVLMVASLAHLPLAIVTAIAFSSPLWIAALAPSLLGETMTRRRWIAVLIGFGGVLVIARPGGPSFAWVLLLPLATALANALRDMQTRELARSETSVSILFWSALLVIIVTALTYPLGWTAVTAADAGWLVLGGLLNALAHFAMIAAFRFADASALAPYRYTALLWALLLGWLVWSHIPDAWSLLGAALIVGAAAYAVDASTARRGARASQ